MKKRITFTVPCYNSQDYMERCVNTLLAGGKRIEIIIVDDGSTDSTGEIADKYAEKYPEIVRVIHQKNGGHGAGVNAGLSLAAGEYFKVVDSDDWVDVKALRQLLAKIEEWESSSTQVDLVVCNYIYDHLYEGRQKRMHYRNVFPKNRICTWDDIGHFRMSQYLVMHALICRTEILKRSGVRLPHHTFYVDNIFANKPLPFVRSIAYLDLDLYHYFLGREDQSVNEKVLMQRIDQQIKVTKIVSGCTNLKEINKEHPKLAAYLVRNLSIMMAISSVHLLMIGTPEALEKRRLLWQYIYMRSRGLYRKLRYSTVSGLTYLPGRMGAWLTLAGYRTAKFIFHFN